MNTNLSGAPVVTDLRVVPVAGQDSMLLNLSGAHGPWFTRNIVILTDSAGNTGLGEVPGGEKIRQTIEDALQHLDLTRERRLRHVQPRRGPAEMQFFRDGGKAAELAEVEHGPS